jgi:NTP pyrophosphatase (non-canonical NTP hydrolase)
MLAPLLVTEDPYAAASIFSQAGWKLEYETARADGQPRACVSLAMARVVLVSATSRPDDALPRGLGVKLQLHVPPRDLSGLFLLHRATGVAVTDLQQVPTGERGFSAEIVGYRFLILAGDPDPDLALIATDPRIAALADGLRQRDGMDSLTDTGLRLAESSGEAVHRLRRALSAGLERQSSAEVGDQLAEVLIAAAILARQLGIDLERPIEAKLGRPAWRGR